MKTNQIRGLMKTFGLLVPAGKGSTFERNVRNLLVDQDGLTPIVLPMLEAWRSMRVRAAELGRQLVAGARQSRACQILVSILKLRERIGFKRAAVAVARKLAVTMHAMLKTGEFFDRTAGATA